ncbi:LysR family transcriptional regulator [Clostridium tagluense]|nr:LysR family transcriptional regulator [Clostridium tagluense]MCB2313548.1 LysR family transcriptional regulator [Clostridium tagluense]MCB2318396.1 LysR family transcriptional regulator [Clostridium tagluense]MCB2328156.1 LysR family transcriptional regulator [Clostridium tagluense]MCB2332915.1 LysR family transcriptional regulator [Clostridium tagluense]WAG52416.1 LysR family transcriptional regulator [Clostridium tagluense]
MNLLHLKYIVEVEKTNSITKAAQNLFMGQPNLSRAIKDLEKKIGITIFKRTAKGVEPTRKGAEFLSYTKAILSQVNELESLYKPCESDVIKFNISVPRATYVSVAFSEFVNSLNEEREINIFFKETNSMEAINDVHNGDSNLGIIRYEKLYENYFLSFLKDSDLEYEPLWEFDLCLLMSKDHPLANLEDIPYYDLCNYTEIVHGDFQVPSLSPSEIKKDAEDRLHLKRICIYERGSQFDLLQRVKGSFMWVSQIPQDVLERQNMILRKSSASSLVNKDIVIYKKNHVFTTYEKLFVDMVKNFTKQ